MMIKVRKYGQIPTNYLNLHTLHSHPRLSLECINTLKCIQLGALLRHVQKSLECCWLRSKKCLVCEQVAWSSHIPPSHEIQQMRWLQEVIVSGISVCVRTMLGHHQGLQLLKDLCCVRENQTSNRRWSVCPFFSDPLLMHTADHLESQRRVVHHTTATVKRNNTGINECHFIRYWQCGITNMFSVALKDHTFQQ